MRALSNRYITVPLNGSDDSQSSGRFAAQRSKTSVAAPALPLSVLEIQAQWRRPYEKARPYIRVV